MAEDIVGKRVRAPLREDDLGETIDAIHVVSLEGIHSNTAKGCLRRANEIRFGVFYGSNGSAGVNPEFNGWLASAHGSPAHESTHPLTPPRRGTGHYGV